MTPFQPAQLKLPPVEELQEQFGLSRKEALEQWHQLLNATVFLNDTYQVVVEVHDTSWGDLIHLSIKRLDKAPVHDWRELQEIKNQIVGPEVEAVELYPAESRLVDTANQYHLWALPNKSTRFPFGYVDRMVTDTPGGNAVQRPRAVQA